MLVYNVILDGSDDYIHEDAADYARGMVWSECETTEQDIRYKHYYETVNGVGVYYDFVGDYYFFTDESEGPREQK
jgi:hypothetical protein